MDQETSPATFDPTLVEKLAPTDAQIDQARTDLSNGYTPEACEFMNGRAATEAAISRDQVEIDRYPVTQSGDQNAS